MTRTVMSAFFGVCALALGVTSVCAKTAPAAPAQTAAAGANATPAGSEPLNTGETPEEAQEHGDGVAAIVNDTVITDYDLRQRVALFVSTAGTRPTADAMKQIKGQVLEQLETERIQLLEAQKNNISVSSTEVDKAIDNISKENHISQDQLNQMLSRNHVKMATLRSQIAAQIAWSKTVQGQYGDRVDVSPEDINDAMRRLAEGKDKPHFLVAEVFQSVDNPEDEPKVLKRMQDLDSQIRAGAPFASVARQFSQNPTAAQGGDLGAVIDGQLPKELNDVLRTMRPGTISDPIRSTGGYYILYLRGRQEAEGTKVAEQAPPPPPVNAHPESLPLSRILLPVGPKPPKDLVARAMQFAQSLREHIAGCEHLPEMVKQIKGAVYMNLGTMRIADLSPQIRDALAQTQGGETAPAFLSSAGVELIVRCDKSAGPPPQQATAFHMPTRDDVEQQLFEERIGVLSRQYMRDLRRDADIEAPGQQFGPRKRSDAPSQ